MLKVPETKVRRDRRENGAGWGTAGWGTAGWGEGVGTAGWVVWG
jgi:hypothetical protein